MRKILTLLTVLSLSALVLAACGRDESASSASSLAPADSAVYAEFTLEPEGDQKRAIDAIVAKFPGSGSAGARLQELIEQGLREADAPITYRDDIKPWLGDEGAFFATAGGRSAELDTAAALLATDDEESARDALEKSFEGKAKEKSYKDVDYLLADDGETAAAVTDGVVVLGSESGLEAALDTADGGSPLSDDEDYETALQDVAKDRLGLFYLNSPELFKATAQWQGAALPGSFRKFFEEPYVATVAADEDGVVFEASTPEALAKTVPFLGQGSELVNELPADSWLALAQPDLGKLADFYIDAFAPVAGGRDTIEGQFKAATGLDLESEVLGWMGDFAVFARGKSKADLDGGLVVETTDPAGHREVPPAAARPGPGPERGRARRSPPSGCRGAARASACVTRIWPSRCTWCCAATASWSPTATARPRMPSTRPSVSATRPSSAPRPSRSTATSCPSTWRWARCST